MFKKGRFTVFSKLDFVSGDTRRSLLAMTLPVMAAMFLTMAYNLVDSLWIGNLLGETAYAALTGSTPVVLILSSVAMGASNGVSILLSRAVGAGDAQEAERLTSTSLLCSVLLSLFLTAGMELAVPDVLSLLRIPQETFALTQTYLSVYLLGYPAVFLYCYFTAVLRSRGDTVFQMLAMLLCTGLNAVLDPLFIRAMGLGGAAGATVLSQSVCLLCMAVYLGKKKLFPFRLRAFSPACAAALWESGLPAALQQSIPAVSTGFLTGLVSGYGITALAAYGIAGRLETLLFYPAMALSLVLTAIVGQCAGAGREDRARDYLRAALRYGGVFLIVLSLPVVLFARQLAALFVPGGGAAEVTAQYFRIVGPGYTLYTLTSCFLGAVNGLGKPGRSLLCMIFYYMAVRMPLAYALSRAGLGLGGIWTAVLLSHVVAVLAAALIYVRVRAVERNLRKAKEFKNLKHSI